MLATVTTHEGSALNFLSLILCCIHLFGLQWARHESFSVCSAACVLSESFLQWEPPSTRHRCHRKRNRSRSATSAD